MPSVFSWPPVITQLLNRKDLSVDDAYAAMTALISGETSDAQIAAFLIALRAKGESIEEIIGFREAVLSHAVELSVPSMALDIVGTGGDGHNTVNISTTASIIAASTGVPVIKHGNRAASSSSGSSDVLAALGINLDLSNQQVGVVLNLVGITFAFAAAFHPSFRHVAQTRKEIGVPTVFNFLGPLCNPARPEASAVGVAQLKNIPIIAGVFRDRGATALVFRGDDGLDELTTTTTNHVWEITQNTITEHVLNPQFFGLQSSSLEDLSGGSPQENAEVLRRTLMGENGPIRDIVLLNAAAGLVSYNLSSDSSQLENSFTDRIAEQLETAAQAIDSGAALEKLDEWVLATNSF